MNFTLIVSIGVTISTASLIPAPDDNNKNQFQVSVSVNRNSLILVSISLLPNGFGLYFSFQGPSIKNVCRDGRGGRSNADICGQGEGR